MARLRRGQLTFLIELRLGGAADFLQIELYAITFIHCILVNVVIIDLDRVQVDDVRAAVDVVVDVLFNRILCSLINLAALFMFFVEDLLCYRLNALVLVATLHHSSARYALYFVVAALVEGLGGAAVGTRDHSPCAHVLCFVVGADEGLQQLVAAQASVAVALQKVVELRLRIVHVELVVRIVFLFVFVFIAVIVVEVFNILLVRTVSRIFSALVGDSFVVLRLVINDLLVLGSLLCLLRII